MSTPAPGMDPRTQASGYRFVIEGLLFLGYAAFGLSWIGYAPFLGTFMTRFALNHAQASLLISVVSLSKIFMPFATGWIAARLGITRAVTLGMFLICACLCTPFAGSYSGVLVSRLVFGLGGAIVVTLMGSAVMEWFPRKELAIVNGFNYVAVNTGISASLLLTPPLATRFGSRRVLIGYAILSAILALLWIAAGKAGPWTRPRITMSSQDSTYLQVLRARETWLLALSFAGPLALYLSFNTWLPTFLAQSRGLSKADSSSLTGLFNTAGIPAAILGGVLTKFSARRKPLIWIPGLLMGLSAFGLLFVSNHRGLAICAITFGIALFIWISPLTTLAMELPGMTPQRLGMVMGIFYSVSYIAAFFSPVLVGALRDRTGSFVGGFSMVAIGSFSLALFGSLLPETGRASER